MKAEDTVGQIKENKGGGTRKLTVDKNATKQQIIDRGKALFFPKGKCKFGKVEEFDYDLWDFAHNPMESDITIGDIYTVTKVKLLRLYLVTIRRSNKDSDSTDDCDLPKLATTKSSKLRNTDILSEAIEKSCIGDENEEVDFEVLFKGVGDLNMPHSSQQLDEIGRAHV